MTRIVVDRIRCDGRGTCAELFPEAIALDDWGYPLITATAVPGHLLSLARRAVSSCPVLALRLARDDHARAAPPPGLTGVSQPQVTVL